VNYVLNMKLKFNFIDFFISNPLYEQLVHHTGNESH
jgi:hypothetical protein